MPEEAKAAGIKLAMPVEKSGQKEFDFEYGDDFGAHIEKYDPDFSKVLVRYNPDGDAEMNRRQSERLKRLADWLHEHDRKFLFELLVPAEEEQLAASAATPTATTPSCARSSCGGRSPSSRTRGVEADIWKIEGVDTRDDCERIAAQARAGGPRRRRVRGARPRGRRRQGRPLAAPGRAGRGLRRLRDRPVDLGRTRSRASSTARSRARRPRRKVADNFLRFVEVYEAAEQAVASR